MTMTQAIEKRQSRREYCNTPIPDEKIVILQEKINSYNEQSGLDILFLEDGSDAFASFGKSYGMFKNIRSLIVLKGKKTLENLKEKIGYYGEMLILDATCLDLGTCWVGGTYDKENPVLKHAPDEEIVCVVTIGMIPAEKGIKEKMLYKSIKRQTKEIEDFYNSEKDVPAWFVKGIQSVQKAPSARNTQKVRWNYEQEKISASVPDDYVFDLVDLGIAKLHFELATNFKLPFGNGSSQKVEAIQ